MHVRPDILSSDSLWAFEFVRCRRYDTPHSLWAGTRALRPGIARASRNPLGHYNFHQLDRFHACFLDKYDYADECLCSYNINFSTSSPCFPRAEGHFYRSRWKTHECICKFLVFFNRSIKLSTCKNFPPVSTLSAHLVGFNRFHTLHFRTLENVNILLTRRVQF